jgi:hypothetical protein
MPRSKKPRYNDAEKNLILRHLAGYLIRAEKAVMAEKIAAGADRNHPFLAGRIKYWENVVSAIKWLANGIDNPIPDVADPGDHTIEEVMEECRQKLGVSSGPESSDSCV